MWIPFGDGLASVTSVHEVVNPSLILHSNLPCHTCRFFSGLLLLSIARTDPFTFRAGPRGDAKHRRPSKSEAPPPLRRLPARKLSTGVGVMANFTTFPAPNPACLSLGSRALPSQSVRTQLCHLIGLHQSAGSSLTIAAFNIRQKRSESRRGSGTCQPCVPPTSLEQRS